MDLLNPKLIWVDDRCYRYLSKNVPLESFYDEEKFEDITINNEELLNFKHVDNGLLYQMEIPLSAIGFIIGKNGTNKKNIEVSAHVKISIKDNIMDIMSSDHKCINKAINMINDSIKKYKKICSPNYFISIPIFSPHFKVKYQNFVNTILEDYQDNRGIDETLFQIPERLHLTLAMLTLITPSEIHTCIEVIKECISDILRELGDLITFKIKFQGIEYMNDDPSDVDVLYADIDPSFGDINMLQTFADGIQDRLVKEGFIERSQIRGMGSVKLHATIMNSRFRKNSNHFQGKSNQTFDAHNIIKHLAQYEFAEVTIDKIHLSQRYKYSKDGYYAAAHIFDFNPDKC